MSGDPNIKKSFWTGALSNYARVFLRMALGLVTFRLLYQGLTREEFGFWALLWSVFGYGILLDFGFGYAAQKRVAELSVRRDWPTLSQVLSTIFLFYLAASAILVSLAFLFSGTLIQWFHVSPENRESFRIALIVFIAGIGLGFPMGIFPEVLRGQQRIAAANQIAMGGMLANFLSVVLVLHFHWPFLTLIVLALLCVLVPDTVAMVVALRRMPEVKIRPAGRYSHTGLSGRGSLSPSSPTPTSRNGRSRGNAHGEKTSASSRRRSSPGGAIAAPRVSRAQMSTPSWMS